MVLAKNLQQDSKSSLSLFILLLQLRAHGLLEFIAAASFSCKASCFLRSTEINRGSMGDLFLALERASVPLGRGEIIQPPPWNAWMISWGCPLRTATSCTQFK